MPGSNPESPVFSAVSFTVSLPEQNDRGGIVFRAARNLRSRIPLRRNLSSGIKVNSERSVTFPTMWKNGAETLIHAKTKPFESGSPDHRLIIDPVPGITHDWNRIRTGRLRVIQEDREVATCMVAIEREGQYGTIRLDASGHEELLDVLGHLDALISSVYPRKAAREFADPDR